MAMEKKYLIINPGSASQKYALYEGELELMRVHMEKTEDGLVANIKSNSIEEKVVISAEQYASSVKYFLDLLVSRGLISSYSDINAVGLRVVAPGQYFLSNKIIDSEYLSQLDKAKEIAPLHIKPEIYEIKQIREVLPEISIVGVSDSLFHSTMPDLARHYGLPGDVAEKYGVYRYGYHGISTHSVLRKIKSMGSVPARVIICHLGGGISITAVKNGQCVDTSMGFTPLEGVVMATRIGNIDAGVVTYLAQKLDLSPDKLGTFFNEKCGLLGLSGKTGDVRELIDLEKKGELNAKLALGVFVYQIKKYIGSYVAILGGLDLLVFTATIGERSFVMRSRICEGMGSLGIVIDETKNIVTVSADGFISRDSSGVRVVVIATDEMGEMAKEILEVF